MAIRMYEESGRVIIEIRERGGDGSENDPAHSRGLTLLQLEERARSFGGSVSSLIVPGDGRIFYIGLPASPTAAPSTLRRL